jgi:hypothetical protein
VAKKTELGKKNPELGRFSHLIVLESGRFFSPVPGVLSLGFSYTPFNDRLGAALGYIRCQNAAASWESPEKKWDDEARNSGGWLMNLWLFNATPSLPATSPHSSSMGRPAPGRRLCVRADARNRDEVERRGCLPHNRREQFRSASWTRLVEWWRGWKWRILRLDRA